MSELLILPKLSPFDSVQDIGREEEGRGGEY